MNNISNKGLLIFLFSFVVFILISLAYKKIRKYMYSSFITTFIVSVLNRNGFISLPIFEKFIYLNYSLLERTELLLFARGDVLCCALNWEYSLNNISSLLFNYLIINLKLIAISFSNLVEKVKIRINILVESLKNKIVQRTNMSRLKMVYRV